MTAKTERHAARIRLRLARYAAAGQPEPDYLARVEPDATFGLDGVPNNCNCCPARVTRRRPECAVFGFRLRPRCTVGRLFLARAHDPEAPRDEDDFW